MALVLSEVNMRSVDPILPLKIQNSNAFNVFFAVVGAFVLCSDGPRAACSPARHGPGDTPAVVPITDTHHKRHLPAQYGRRSEPERVRSSRRRVHVGRGPCLVVGGIPLTHTHNALPRWCLCEKHHPGVCGRALDVRGRGCVGDGLLQRRDDRRKRTHERKAGPAE
jgi:hypothetical protein